MVERKSKPPMKPATNFGPALKDFIKTVGEVSAARYKEMIASGTFAERYRRDQTPPTPTDAVARQPGTFGLNLAVRMSGSSQPIAEASYDGKRKVLRLRLEGEDRAREVVFAGVTTASRALPAGEFSARAEVVVDLQNREFRFAIPKSPDTLSAPQERPGDLSPWHQRQLRAADADASGRADETSDDQ